MAAEAVPPVPAQGETASPVEARAETVLDAIRRRRVARAFTPEPVSEAELRRVLEAARWASSGGNRRLHRLVVVRDPARIRLVKAFSPGMLAAPPALIIVCTDTAKALREQPQFDRHPTTLIDVGTTVMTMLLAAHVLGLGACPVTAFSRSAVPVLLNLPPELRPELMLMLGHPAPEPPRPRRPGASTRLTVDDLTLWDPVG